jgi:PhnB protein
MRPGFHTITPYVVIREASRALDFYQKVLGAVPGFCERDPDGRVRHAELKIGDSMLMLTDEPEEFPYMRSVQTMGGSPVQMFVYVEDVDQLAADFVANGAKTIMPLEDKDYGRTGGFEDPFGLIWWFARHKAFKQ